MDVRADERPSAAERWRDIRRNNLLDAASRIFARQGYEAASVEEIAFEAGIGKPTVYRYFPSKEALFEAAFGHALDDLESRLDTAMVLPGGFEQRLVRLVTEIVPTIRTHFGSISPMGEGETSKRRLFRQRRGQVEARLKAAIEAGQARGEARPFEAGLAAKLMIGMVRSGVTADHLSDAQIAQAVVGLALRGLGAPSPAAEAVP
ncbi:TetR/AcrR family transcriptional regulator [Labrys monachus]|uniref:AcrR family transcriptional regulator n=1 Tax=Labrys monachus TaxID=217067 RepID=A0ABU0FLX4_9HYPH|nr:TetR/AcrR family transcriptional regulator [Labrys monachus]MDQ0395604.1 AcrR family transcriptional regulator [Labrys monachus]